MTTLIHGPFTETTSPGSRAPSTERRSPNPRPWLRKPEARTPGAHSRTGHLSRSRALGSSLRREAFAAELAALEASEGAIVIHTCHRVELYVRAGDLR